MSGILEVFGQGVRAVSHREWVDLATYRKFINWDRWPVDASSNRPKVAHCLDLLNALHGKPSAGSVAENVAWWRRTFADTPLCIDEEDSRVYMCVLWGPEIVVASLALTEPQLADLLPLIDKRMYAWLGKVVPKSRRGAPKKIHNHRIGIAGEIVGDGAPVPSQGVCWLGIGDRSIVLNRDGGSDKRTYLDANPANQWLALMLGIEFSGANDSHAKQFEAAFRRRSGGKLWQPSDERRAAALAAMNGLPHNLAEVFMWQSAVPLPKHESEVGRTYSGLWCRFTHTKDGTTQGGSGSASDDNGDRWLTAMPGTRESKGGADNVQPCTAVLEDVHGRRIVCWPDRSPSLRYSTPLPIGEDLFRATSGPSGLRVLVPAPEPVDEDPVDDVTVGDSDPTKKPSMNWFQRLLHFFGRGKN